MLTCRVVVFLPGLGRHGRRDGEGGRTRTGDLSGWRCPPTPSPPMPSGTRWLAVTTAQDRSFGGDSGFRDVAGDDRVAGGAP